MANKKALIVGINYTGTGNDLRGCINDANNVEFMLKNRFGFTNIKKLLEREATTDNIKAGMAWLVEDVMPGDVLYFHYSGHGSQIRDTNTDESDGFDEILCPIDLNWRDKVITDDYMKSVFDRVPFGVSLTVVFDCCHSGSALDQSNQYQPVTTRDLATEATIRSIEPLSRYLPPPAEVLQEASLADIKPAPYQVQSRNVNQSALLITGCRSDQTSADAYINGVYQGAATYAMISILAANNYNLDYKTLVEKMNEFMIQNGYSQRPELNGPEALFVKKFLATFDEMPIVEESTIDQTSHVKPVTNNEKESTIFDGILIAGGILTFIFLLLKFF